MSSFGSLNLGARAIFAAQRGLDVTGQNIANSATPGYSRQRVDQVAVGGPTVPAIWAKYDQAGGGVKVTGISRMRDEFLEARARTAHQTQGDYAEKQKVYEALERTFGEPSTKQLQAQLGEYWTAWSGIANDVTAAAPRGVVLQKAQAVINQFNSMGKQIATQWDDARTEFNANVDDVNAMAKDIARLNRAIKNNVINGLPANELADQRDQLVEKVTTLTGAKAEPAADGVVNVRLGGGTGDYLVNDRFYAQVGATGPAGYDASLPARPAAVGVTWTAGLRDISDPLAAAAPTPASVVLTSATTGTMAGQLTNMNTTLPDYMDDLNKVAQSFADKVNSQQQQGYTPPLDAANPGQAGSDMFTSDGAANTGITAKNLQLASGFTANQLAVSDTQWDATGKVLNANNALKMAGHLSDKDGPDAAYRSLIAKLGTEAQSISRNKTAADNVVKNADDARDSVSGVSLNEEMTHLVQYQHSFQAAAKFITAVDATIESLLNMTH
ncbi:MAG: flagellar hook-associated protein FlgK [Actinobacteria bacterium]|nr:flagellar hook-associated protein FlgK [Actinomycetota bacterium]